MNSYKNHPSVKMDGDGKIFPRLSFEALQKHADGWASAAKQFGISFQNITLYSVPKSYCKECIYNIILRVRQVEIPPGIRASIANQVDQRRRGKKQHWLSMVSEEMEAKYILLEQFCQYLTPENEYLFPVLFRGFDEVYRPEYGLPGPDFLKEWRFDISGKPDDNFRADSFWMADFSKAYNWVLYTNDITENMPVSDQRSVYDFFSKKDIAGYLKISESTIKKFLKKDPNHPNRQILPHKKMVNGRIYAKKDEVDEWWDKVKQKK